MELLDQKVFLILVILVLGSSFGRVSVRGFSLGSAGVLLTALLFGHFGYQVPQVIADMGLVLFVYAVGLHAAPRFFASFTKDTRRYIVLAAAPIFITLFATVFLGKLLSLPKELIIGMFSGAVHSTPALAAAVDALSVKGTTLTSEASVCFGVVYPFSLFGVILIVQLLPKLLHRTLEVEEAKWNEEQKKDATSIVLKHFKVSNPNIIGKKIKEVRPRSFGDANISRITRSEHTLPASAEVKLELGDIVTVVGNEAQIEGLKFFFGDEIKEVPTVDKNVAFVDVEVSEVKITGKPLAELKIFEEHQVLITRIRRHGIEYIATGKSYIEIGDYIRFVGTPDAVDKFAKFSGSRQHIVEETSIVPFLAGLLIGVFLGTVSFPVGDLFTIRLGPAGGAFVASLLFGHFGKVGSLKLYVPVAARNICRELGLLFFLAGAGTAAGKDLMSIIASNGGTIIPIGISLTVICIATCIISTHWFYKMNLIATLGSLCGNMQNGTALSSVQQKTPSELVSITYAAVYPLSLILKIVAVQLLVLLM
jgi:putative transport protein